MLRKFIFLICSIFLCLFYSTANAQDYSLIHTYKIESSEESNQYFEMSGLTLFKDFVLMLPQHENAIYYKKKKEILNNSGNTSPLKKIPFEFKEKEVPNDGWEALTIRKSAADSLYLYMALEKCGGENSCIYYSKLIPSNKNDIPFQIEPVRQFGRENPGWKNLSYEAITWVDYPKHNLSGLLLLPEKISQERLHPIFINESGEYIKVTSNSGMENLRISDMAQVTPMSNKSYIAVSFCWKGVDRAFTHADDWCFKTNDVWQSKLELLTLNIEPRNGAIHVNVLYKRRLEESFVDVSGPEQSRTHQYNAEGIAVLPNGNIMLINDNYPDGPYTEIRILSLNLD